MRDGDGAVAGEVGTAGRAAVERAVAVFLTAAAALVLLGLLVWALTPADPPHATPEVARRFLLAEPFRHWHSGLFPEPGERRLFVVLTLASPWAAIAADRLWRGRAVPRSVMLMGAGVLAASVIALLLALGPSIALSLASLSPPLILAVVVSALVPELLHRSGRAIPSRRAAAAVAAALSVLIAVATKYHDLSMVTDWYWDTYHLSAVLFSVAESAGGRRCLIDYVPQYGCYAEFVAPLTTLAGGTLRALSLVMIALTIAGLSAVAIWLFRLLRSTAVAALGMALILLQISVPLWLYNRDPYYQYFPIRFVLPALALPLGLRWHRRPSAGLAAAFGALSAAAFVWNPDSGLSVTGSLLAVIAFDLLPGPGRAPRMVAALRALAMVLSMALGLVALAAFQHARSGHWPLPSRLFQYANLFFGAGFFMVPMPRRLDAWQAVAALLLGAVARGVCGRADDPRSRAALQLGALGLSAFTYYVGRSIPTVLALACWPAVPAAALLADEALAVVPSRRARAGFAAAAASTLTLSLVLMVQQVTGDHFTRLSAPPHAVTRADVDYLRRTSSPSDRIAVLATHQAVLLLEAHRVQALRGPGRAELILRSDADDQARQLTEGDIDLLYVELRYLVTSGSIWLGPIWPAIERRYEPVSASPDKSLQLWRLRR